MAKVEPFEIERWMDIYEPTAKYNIAETCAASISITDLQSLSDDKSKPVLEPSTKLVYGAITGSHALRSNIANLYSARAPSSLSPDSVLITPGGIAANFLSIYAHIGRGDHVICHYPTYQQLYSVPASLGAEVSLWKSRPENKWALDVDELETLIKPNTKMLIVNNPQNPTGAIIPKPVLELIVSFARTHDLYLLSDEVYRPLFHSISPLDSSFPPSVLSLSYPKAIVTGSLSKAYALAGIRVGWIASRDPAIIAACNQARDYTTISVSQVDDQIATYALSPDCVHNLLARNIELARSNLRLLEGFIEEFSWACDWVRPVGGTTAFVRFKKGDERGRAVDDVAFCRLLQEKTGVMFAPGGHCFGHGKEFKGHVRIGFVCEADVLKEGLEMLKGFMRKGYESVPMAE